ncbi:hypothetical protein RA27_13810 [Ruegeria sp. ANG-R]|uniref:hypothetical protein n=1 Tax=Ruegeria sp. ANG-R TaxID=1577903 RepID=UPI0005805E23|nr:hypothetical protein [Ruegeria sp. ANG-R]KIC40821.1 hypothetical protein RA27_13810 [Ruegeria sp. ANG-R]
MLRRRIRQFRQNVSYQYYEEKSGIVQSGLLSGFKLIDEHTWGQADLLTKLLGLYEQQNLPILGGSSKSTLVDIGAADGYWGVGLVYAGCFDQSVCFEQRGRGRRVIRRTAVANDIREKVRVAGAATFESLQAELGGLYQPEDLFFLIDIEGGEFDLLTFEFLSKYRASEFLIELHTGGDPSAPEKEKRLIQDARKLFNVCVLDDTKRDLRQLRSEIYLPDDLTWLFASEGRGYPMSWLHLSPRSEDAV